MKNHTVLQINSYQRGSTGGIMMGIHAALDSGFSGYCAYGNEKAIAVADTIAAEEDPAIIWIGDEPALRRGPYSSQLWSKSVQRHVWRSFLFDRHGFGSKRATQTFIRQIETINPDLIHLHNIHGYYLHLGVLFSYLQSLDIPIVWTLHDCWSFTGHCSYFDPVSCSKWVDGCFGCPQSREYPTSRVLDRSRKNYKDKKKLFTSLKNGHLTAPSVWMQNTARKSFLGSYPIHLIMNGIDLDVFKPVEVEGLRTKHGIPDDVTVLLNVTDGLAPIKGFQYILEMAKLIPEDMVIVVVGLHEKQLESLPANVIGIPVTRNREELAQLYSAADVFINPTLADTCPLVVLEALACGLPSAAFASGGVPELVPEACGRVVPPRDTAALYQAVCEILLIGKNKFSPACIKKAAALSIAKSYSGYLSLYRELLETEGGKL
ncbi:MAG: glycosyltransferase [Spirochaetales bacterium]|nr:glycosyltransferase [Spirochaetales bacterium]